jgi:hypothetical protein
MRVAVAMLALIGCAAPPQPVAPPDADNIVEVTSGTGKQYVSRNGRWKLEDRTIPKGWYAAPPAERLRPEPRRGWWDR